MPMRQGTGHRIRRGLGVFVAISIIIVLAACGSSTASSGPASIAIVDLGKVFAMVVGTNVTLRTVVNDAAGNNIANAVVSFTSRKPQVAIVDGAGAVTGVASGNTYIVASTVNGARTLSDSVLVDVGMLISR